MKRLFWVVSFALMLAFNINAGAQGQGGHRGPGSNAPGTRDREFGHDRAIDAGQGKHKGLQNESKKGGKKKKGGNEKSEKDERSENNEKNEKK